MPNVRRRPWPWLPFGLGWVRNITRVEPGAIEATPYLDRYSLSAQGPSGTNPWRVYLHHFHAPDQPGVHNHPSRWSLALILWGSYTEEHPVLTRAGTPSHTGLVTRRRVRWWNFIRDTTYHRIAELHPGPGATGVWTVFVCGPLSGRGWGFFRPGVGHVPVTDSEGK